MPYWLAIQRFFFCLLCLGFAWPLALQAQDVRPNPAPGKAAQPPARSIGVFVALADNQNQGIVPVPAAIGNGEDPEHNLYWGTAEGFKGVFDHSKDWKLTAKQEAPEKPGASVLRARTYRNEARNALLQAQAYKGAAIRQCLLDFEAAIQSGRYDLVVYIGHNGLMDFNLPKPTAPGPQARRPDVIVLCCKSAPYFQERIEAAGGRPVLLTTQFMYPGAFILQAAAEGWLKGESRTAIRNRAGTAYANNQKLSKKAGTGVFAALQE